jgi:orotate phosphoribosyltransferase
MPATTLWAARAHERTAELERYGVFWHHDGHPRRPYVKLRSGLISNGYFNGGVLMENPVLLERIVSDLVTEYVERKSSPDIPDRVLGPAMGGITLAHEVARILGITYCRDDVRMSFAEKEDGEFVFKRNPPRPFEQMLLVEDTITTAGSIRKVRTAAVKLLAKPLFVPYLLVLCNRTNETHIDELEIISYVDGSFKTWKEGANPFTEDGSEPVSVVENVKENWSVLTQDYA